MYILYTHSFRFCVRTSFSLKHPKNAGLNSQGLHSQWLVFKLHLCMNISSNLKGTALAGHTSLAVVNAGVPTTLTSLEIKIGKFNSKSLEKVENQANKQQKSGLGVFGSEVSICFSLVFSAHFQPRSHQITLVISHAAHHFSRATIPFFRRAGNHHHFHAFLWEKIGEKNTKWEN